MEAKDDDLIFHQIIAPITSEEISFLQEFGIEDGSGSVDNKEFIIMAVMRIGGASPDLIKRINDRFKELDRKHVGKIAYDDILVGKKDPLTTQSSSGTSDSSSRRRALSSRRKSRANSTIFAARAKTIFQTRGVSGSSDIAANILRIEELMSSSPSSSRRIPAPKCGFSDSDSDDGSETHSRRMVSCKYTMMMAMRDDEDSSEEDVESSCCRSNSLDSSLVCDNDDMNSQQESFTSLNFSVDCDSDRVPSLGEREDIDGQLNDNNTVCNDQNCMTDETESFPDVPKGEIKTVVSMTLQRLSMSRKTKISRSAPPKVYPLVIPNDMANKDHEGHNLCEGVESVCGEVADTKGSAQEKDFVLEDLDSSDCTSTSEVEPSTNNATNTMAQSSQQTICCLAERFGPDNTDSQKGNDSQKSNDSQKRDVTAVVKSKHYEKLEQAKKQRRMSKKLSLENKNKSSWELRMQYTKRVLTCSYAIAFYLWCLWLSIGTVYYIFEENVAFCKGVFISTSIGYGIFWYEQTSTSTLSQVFSLCHYYIGVLAVSFAMAVFARNLNVSKKLWYEDARLLYSMRTASLTSGRWRDVGIYFEYYWPKVYVHVIFVFWMVLGIVWGVCSIKWGVLDAWFFAMTAMAKGGLVTLPSSGVHQWDYLFYSVYISVGAPLLAYSCGTAASAISSYGRAQQKEKELNAPMTEDELVMLNHLGVEDDDGFIDGAEFTILLLVRIGALNADLIDVLHDRYYELDADGTGAGVTYEALQNRKSFMNSSRKLSLSTQLSSRGAELVDKLRQRSMGG